MLTAARMSSQLCWMAHHLPLQPLSQAALVIVRPQVIFLGLAIVSCNRKRNLPHPSVAAGAIAEAPAESEARGRGRASLAARGYLRPRSGARQSADSWWLQLLQPPEVTVAEGPGPTSVAVAPLHPVPLPQAQNRLHRRRSVVHLTCTGAAIAASS